MDERIVGIVASAIETLPAHRRADDDSNGFVTGSAAASGFDTRPWNHAADLLESGGHMYAAGMTMKPENVARCSRSGLQHLLSSTVEMLIDAGRYRFGTAQRYHAHFSATLAVQPFGQYRAGIRHTEYI